MHAGGHSHRTSDTHLPHQSLPPGSPRHAEITEPVLNVIDPLSPSGKVASEVDRIETSQAQAAATPADIVPHSPPSRPASRPPPLSDDFSGLTRVRPFAVQAALDGRGNCPSPRPVDASLSPSPLEQLVSPSDPSHGTYTHHVSSPSPSTKDLSTEKHAVPVPPDAARSAPVHQQQSDSDPSADSGAQKSTSADAPAAFESHPPVYGHSVPAGLETLMRGFEPAPAQGATDPQPQQMTSSYPAHHFAGTLPTGSQSGQLTGTLPLPHPQQSSRQGSMEIEGAEMGTHQTPTECSGTGAPQVELTPNPHCLASSLSREDSSLPSIWSISSPRSAAATTMPPSTHAYAQDSTSAISAATVPPGASENGYTWSTSGGVDTIQPPQATPMVPVDDRDTSRLQKPSDRGYRTPSFGRCTTEPPSQKLQGVSVQQGTVEFASSSMLQPGLPNGHTGQDIHHTEESASQSDQPFVQSGQHASPIGQNCSHTGQILPLSRQGSSNISQPTQNAPSADGSSHSISRSLPQQPVGPPVSMPPPRQTSDVAPNNASGNGANVHTPAAADQQHSVEDSRLQHVSQVPMTEHGALVVQRSGAVQHAPSHEASTVGGPMYTPSAVPDTHAQLRTISGNTRQPSYPPSSHIFHQTSVATNDPTTARVHSIDAPPSQPPHAGPSASQKAVAVVGTPLNTQMHPSTVPAYADIQPAVNAMQAANTHDIHAYGHQHPGYLPAVSSIPGFIPRADTYGSSVNDTMHATLPQAEASAASAMALHAGGAVSMHLDATVADQSTQPYMHSLAQTTQVNSISTANMHLQAQPQEQPSGVDTSTTQAHVSLAPVLQSSSLAPGNAPYDQSTGAAIPHRSNSDAQLTKHTLFVPPPAYAPAHPSAYGAHPNSQSPGEND